MSAEKIIQQIKKDAEKEIKQILAEAEKQAKQIINEAKKQTEKEAEKILTNGKKQSENLERIMIAKVSQNAKREIMRTQEKIIEECFTRASEKLSKLKVEDYKNMVSRLIKDGEKKLGEQCNMIISRETDREIAEEMGFAIVGNIKASGGVVLQSQDGRITLDNTFDGILRRKKDKIRVKVGKILFS